MICYGFLHDILRDQNRKNVKKKEQRNRKIKSVQNCGQRSWSNNRIKSSVEFLILIYLLLYIFIVDV